MRDVLVDTNVAVIANRIAGHSCASVCLEQLEQFFSGERRLILDDGGDILREYLKQRPHGYPRGPGDQFLVWAFTNQGNPSRCGLVPITPHPDRGYEEFPDDVGLAGFDRDDRMFVASAIVHGGRPPIWNAGDSDWRNFATSLAPYVDVIELCEGI